MKLDAMGAAALALAGLAVFVFAKNYRAAHPQHDASVSDAESQQWLAQARAQRQDNGAALSQNTDYLKNWQGLQTTFASQPDFYV
jgi:hypothetical protein